MKALILIGSFMALGNCFSQNNTKVFYSYSQNDTEKHSYVLLTYGIKKENSNAELIVNQMWNIAKKVVAGCEVTQELVDSVKTHNKNTWNSLKTDYKITDPET